MNVTHEVINDIPVVKVSGEVDMSNCGYIDNVVATTVSNQAFALILDLSEVTYVDSAGVRLLYQLDARLEVHQQRLIVLVPAGAAILRTLQAAGVIGSLMLASSLDAALLVAQSPREQHGDTNAPTG